MKIDEFAKKLASEMADFERADGTKYTDTVDNAVHEDLLRDLAYELHEGLFPCDWIYAELHRTLHDIADGQTEPQSEPDIYTHKLLDWLKTYPNALDLADEALSELGAKTIIDAVQYAQIQERDRIFTSVFTRLEELCQE